MEKEARGTTKEKERAKAREIIGDSRRMAKATTGIAVPVESLAIEGRRDHARCRR